MDIIIIMLSLCEARTCAVLPHATGTGNVLSYDNPITVDFDTTRFDCCQMIIFFRTTKAIYNSQPAVLSLS